MRSENPTAEVRRQIEEEVRAARTREDWWLLVYLSRKDDGKISLGADTTRSGMAQRSVQAGMRF